jgi:hypothetical protein
LRPRPNAGQKLGEAKIAEAIVAAAARATPSL